MTRLLIVLLLIICKSYGQDQKKKYDFVFSPGVILQNEVFGEANLGIGEVHNTKMIVGFSGARIGLETNFKNGSEFTIAPKIGLEVCATIVSVRISAINYFQNENSEFRIVPELGISFGSFVNLTYGYGVRFQKKEISNLSQHRLSLTFNVSRKIIKECVPNL